MKRVPLHIGWAFLAAAVTFGLVMTFAPSQTTAQIYSDSGTAGRLRFGSTPIAASATAPTAGQYLKVSGNPRKIVGVDPLTMGNLLTSNGTTLSNDLGFDVNSDPRTGGGQAADVGQFAHDGTYWYRKRYTGVNDWKREAAWCATAGSNVTTLSIATSASTPPLNGDRDGGYRIRWYIKAANVSTPAIYLQLQGGTTNQTVRRTYQGGGNDTLSNFAVATAVDQNQYAFGEGFLTSRSGRIRFYQAQYSAGNAGTPAAVVQVMGVYNDTSTVIDDIGLASDTSSAIATGSTVCLYAEGDPKF